MALNVVVGVAIRRGGGGNSIANSSGVEDGGVTAFGEETGKGGGDVGLNDEVGEAIIHIK